MSWTCFVIAELNFKISIKNQGSYSKQKSDQGDIFIKNLQFREHHSLLYRLELELLVSRLTADASFSQISSFLFSLEGLRSSHTRNGKRPGQTGDRAARFQWSYIALILLELFEPQADTCTFESQLQRYTSASYESLLHFIGTLRGIG